MTYPKAAQRRSLRPIRAQCAWPLAAALGLLLAACGGGGGNSLQVATSAGTVEGVETATHYQYLGIPYAAPPVGALRWVAPQPAAAWSGVRAAKAFGNHCPQPTTPGLGYGFAGGQEDCLYLNVYAPRTPGPHPVMVWIHGGAFVLGRSNSYAPGRLVEQQNVVVVTLNYRLGSLGYLAHPALADANGRSGNYGYLDQVAALKWVQANIAAFGGDSGNVTLFGQSAGGLSALAQLASPLAKGLFHKAVVQSAPGLTLMSQTAANVVGATVAARTPVAATATTAQVTGFNCPNDAKAAACLRALPADTIVANQPGSFSPVNQPVIDGHFLAQDLLASISAGLGSKVPVVVGSVHDEFTSFLGQTELRTGVPMSAAAYPVALAAQFTSPPAPAGFAALLASTLYPLSAFPGSSGPSLAFSAAVGDSLFACPTRKLAKTLQASGVPLFAYEFNDPNAPMTLQPAVSFPYKAYHASEIQYLFDVPASTLSTAQQQLAASMQTRWAQFARSGHPALLDAPWPAYGSAENLLSLAPAGTGAGTVVTTGFAADHKCAVWTPGV